jgi:hypothetical protein
LFGAHAHHDTRVFHQLAELPRPVNRRVKPIHSSDTICAFIRSTTAST